MDILGVIIVLLVLLLAAAWSSARSYFVKGRLAGMEEATLEIIRGVRSHYERAGRLPKAKKIASICRSTNCCRSLRWPISVSRR
jgi:hypothetical protein